MSECLCPLRLYIQQEKCQELRRHLDKLMDHNDDVTDEEVSFLVDYIVRLFIALKFLLKWFWIIKFYLGAEQQNNSHLKNYKPCNLEKQCKE